MSLIAIALLLCLIPPTASGSGETGSSKSTPDGKAMALIPGGYYTPPFQEQNGKERVWVAAFRMDTRPVTIGEYLAFVREHTNWRKSGVKRIFADSTYLSTWTGDLIPPSSGSLNRPVTEVSWYAAKDYCGTLGKSLPGTREWERAALAVPKGEDSSSYVALILDWYGKPASSGQHAAPGSMNAYGVHDLFGKIWEWTLDYNSEGLLRANEFGEKNKSLFCGGTAAATTSRLDYATWMRFAFRSSLKPEFTTRSLGFRCIEEQ